MKTPSDSGDASLIRASYEGGPGKHAAVGDNVLMALFLIIEPDDDIRRLYAAVVRGLGHEPVFPDSGSIAEPHVILVEPAHPASFEAAQQLRHDYPAVPIVCASIYEPTHEQAQLLHATTYLLKPFSLVELTNALQAALRNLTLCPSS